ncbi:MAG TPA: hypothetical protein PK725_01190 [Rhodocyclaceae bacterium]|nr:hypothetical protein [Rhodocyclaceae bacterium]
MATNHAYGWIITVSPLPSPREDRKRFGINLIRPAAFPLDPGSPRGPEYPKAATELGDLFFPWKWKGIQWHVFAEKEGAWTEIAAESITCQATANSDKCPSSESLRGAIENEISEASSNCQYPFSQDILDYWGEGQTRSLVHSLAPLTHWPAVASGSVLHLTWVIEIAQANLADAIQVICVPEFSFDVGGKALDTGEPKEPTHDTSLDLQIAAYPTDSVSINMGCEAATIEVNPSCEPSLLSLKQGELSRSALHALVVSHLLPLRVLAEWIRSLIDQEADPFKGNEQVKQALSGALWKSLGFGEEYAPAFSKQSPDIGEHPPFIVELLIPDEWGSKANDLKQDVSLDYRKKLKNFQLDDDEARTAFRHSIDFLARSQNLSGSYTAERRQQWALASEAWSRLVQPKQWRLTDWLELADLLLSDQGACEFFGPWLAQALGPKFAGKPWRSFAIGEKKVLGVHEQLLLPGGIRLDMWQRVVAARLSDEQWSAIAAPGDSHNFLATATLNAVHELLCLPGRDPQLLGAEGASLAAQVEHQVEQFSQQRTAQSSGARIRPKDRGIELLLESELCQVVTDETIRGYAVALCAAINTQNVWKPDLKRAHWITDTALWYKSNATPNDGDWLKSTGGSVLWMHETIGATESNGERVTSVEFTGLPLSSTLAKPTGVAYDPDPDALDRDGLKSVDFAWPWKDVDDCITEADGTCDSGADGARDLPMLAYGAYYRAVAVPIGNAGVPLSEDLLAATEIRPHELRSAKELEEFTSDKWRTGDFRYLSSRRPAAPRVVKDMDIDERIYELDEDTQGHAFQSQGLTNPNQARADPAPNQARADPAQPSHRVALIAGDAVRKWLQPDVKEQCEFTITGPVTDADFCRRWLAMDRMAKSLGLHGLYSHPDFAKDEVTKEELLRLDTELCGRRFEGKEGGAPPDPSVTAIAVEVWNPYEALEKGTNPRHIEPVKIGFALNEERLSWIDIKLKIRVSATDGGEWRVLPPDKKPLEIKIVLPPGQFVRIRAYSLVRKEHFDHEGSEQRFADEIKDAEAPEWGNYRAFGVLERWVEAMPSWDQDTSDRLNVEIRACAPATEGNSEDLVSVHAAFKSQHPPYWIRDLYLQRHEWHWTGGLLPFPSFGSTDVNEWLPSLAGVESYRESESIRLGTSFTGDRQEGFAWKLGQDNQETFFRRALSSGPRPARFEAYFVRLVPRFRKWLNAGEPGGPLGLESKTFAAVALLPGRGSTQADARLPPPVLRWAVPLTTTHEVVGESESGGPKRTSNGVMLVFDEALHRTDDLADVGGLGEVIEVDLVDTRDPEYPEIGVNPIFHPLRMPDQDGPKPKELRLTATQAFGLTHDIGPNPKVAQTALVVRPENAGGRWIMAKVRTRRLILPETEFGEILRFDNGTWKWTCRKAGEDKAPVDLAIDIQRQQVQSIKLLVSSDATADPDEFDLSPKAISPETERVLITWHKGRWGDGVSVSWGCQILEQKRENPDALTWRTLHKTSCHEIAQKKQGLNHGTFVHMQLSLEIEMKQEGAVERVSVLRCSDYTDPMWLSFIGTFEQNGIGDPTDYRVSINHDGKKETLILSSPLLEVPLPRVRHSSEVVDLTTGGRDASSFHITLIYRQVPDVLRGRSGADGGVLEQVFMAADSQDPGQREVKFESLPAEIGAQLGSGARHAYIFSVQADSGFTGGVEDWKDLLNGLFPANGNAESRLRLLPEYLGPIVIDEG